MKIPRLGLVCISARLAKQKVAAKTMTRKSFLNNSKEKSIATLSERILHNSRHVLQTLRAAHAVGAGHYRVSSSLFPLLTDSTLELSYDDLHSFDTIASNLRAAGDFARDHNITLSSHPDQFNVLASYNPDVVRRTILELNHQSFILDMMGTAKDYSAPMCLHLNKTPEERHETIDEYVSRFHSNLAQCNESVRNRLVLENEDKAYWNCATLYDKFGDKIPLVYDNLHDVCNPSSDPCENAARFRKTWHKHTPVFHWSEGIGSTRSHADYATHLPHVVSQNADVTWEVELKAKDNAIAHIMESFFRQ